ncbi:MAG: hypothetical protein ACPG1A_01205 [Halioglobus sp.]
MADQMDNVDSKTEKLEQDFKARRRLLKASAAVPLIGTLAPGSTLAGGQAATSTQCDLKSGKYDKVTKYDDHALRARARYWKSKGSADNLYEIAGKFYSAYDGRRQYPRLKSNGNPRHYRDRGTRYVLCYVDVGRYGDTGKIRSNDVKIAGVYPQRNTGGKPMSDSCWDSIGGIHNIIYDKANG